MSKLDNILDEYHKYLTLRKLCKAEHTPYLLRWAKQFLRFARDKTGHKSERIVANVQESVRLRLGNSGLRPSGHPVWTPSAWKVFLSHPDDIRRTIRYIRENPLKGRIPEQNWTFITEYDGWPLHPGHNPNSPYAKRLRDRKR
ncbi:MAG: hypothetical protein GY794_09405 [bacterium]|nr:hypothetical protein [bacterium]